MNDIVNDKKGRNIVNDIMYDKKGSLLWTTNSFAHEPEGLLVNTVINILTPFSNRSNLRITDCTT